ncbi:uncharacterized protein [Musca autumnalis]|uniref:uncharacterized protein n=1 Tax=Musca autumnalis TaxID=221902 RepID=UPI003CF207C2
MVASTAEDPLVCYTLSLLNDDTQSSSDVCNGTVDIFPFLVIILVGAAFTVFYLFFSFTIDLIGKKNLILIWIVVSCICVTLLHWITNFYLIVTLLTFTMSIGNVGGLVSTISMEFFPTNINAMGMCFIMMIGRLGAVLGSNFIGVLLYNYCDVTFWGMAAASVVLLFLSWFLPEKKYQKNKKVIHATTS